MTLKEQIYRELEPLSESDELLKTIWKLIHTKQQEEAYRRGYEMFPDTDKVGECQMKMLASMYEREEEWQ